MALSRTANKSSALLEKERNSRPGPPQEKVFGEPVAPADIVRLANRKMPHVKIIKKNYLF